MQSRLSVCPVLSCPVLSCPVSVSLCLCVSVSLCLCVSVSLCLCAAAAAAAAATYASVCKCRLCGNPLCGRVCGCPRSGAERGPVSHELPFPQSDSVSFSDAPTVHDIATPRRTIGGRCRKWCISAQPPAGKRKCAACSMCGIRLTLGKARLQQWGNRQTNNHYVHAHCVNGGLGHDHELHPKVADDQEAVDAVTRQRDTITRTAADTEVLLLLAQDPDQASTAAPPMISEICLVVKRLSAWMKKSWTFNDLNTLHGTASKTCVARRMSNLP